MNRTENIGNHCRWYTTGLEFHPQLLSLAAAAVSFGRRLLLLLLRLPRGWVSYVSAANAHLDFGVVRLVNPVSKAAEASEWVSTSASLCCHTGGTFSFLGYAIKSEFLAGRENNFSYSWPEQSSRPHKSVPCQSTTEHNVAASVVSRRTHPRWWQFALARRGTYAAFHIRRDLWQTIAPKFTYLFVECRQWVAIHWVAKPNTRSGNLVTRVRID